MTTQKKDKLSSTTTLISRPYSQYGKIAFDLVILHFDRTGTNLVRGKLLYWKNCQMQIVKTDDTVAEAYCCEDVLKTAFQRAEASKVLQYPPLRY